MGKIAFVFSGQGAQYSGMGKSLYEVSQGAKKLYDACEKLRPGTMEQSFSGSEEELRDTKNTQPCMYLVELSAAESLREHGITADGVAGFSLGEISALAYAGAYSYEDGFRIVAKRGELMSQAAGEHDTAMAAILKLDDKTVEDAVACFDDLYAVNFNCPGQVVVSGSKSSVDAFADAVKRLGGRMIPLAVSAAFHSPFMAGAAEQFSETLKEFTVNMPELPVYANLTAKTYDRSPAEILPEQMKNPVRWQHTIENMIADGYTDFIELGPGKTLCGLIKKISKDVRVYSVQDAESLENTISEVREHAEK